MSAKLKSPARNHTWLARCVIKPMFASLAVQGSVWPVLESKFCGNNTVDRSKGRRVKSRKHPARL